MRPLSLEVWGLQVLRLGQMFVVVVVFFFLGGGNWQLPKKLIGKNQKIEFRIVM